MINTHEKLMKNILSKRFSEESILEKLRTAGFIGEKEDLCWQLIAGFEETSAYRCDSRKVSNNEVMTEEEYFEMLAKAMNSLS